jgi:hypothetical protein
MPRAKATCQVNMTFLFNMTDPSCLKRVMDGELIGVNCNNLTAYSSRLVQAEFRKIASLPHDMPSHEWKSITYFEFYQKILSARACEHSIIQFLSFATTVCDTAEET